MISIAEAEVASFFESYRAAFESFDASALSDHLAYPAQIASDDDGVKLIVLESGQAYQRMIEPLFAMYRRLGVRTGRIVKLSISAVSIRIVQAVVCWEILDGDARPLYAHKAAYTLATGSTGWRIAAICVNELPALKKCLGAC